MSRGYTSRSIAANVSRHTVAPLPDLTNAEIDALVYRQTWQSRSTPQGVISFAVLALDEAHAVEVGGARLVAQSGEGVLGDMVITENRPLHWDAELVAGCMVIEPLEARTERRTRHATQAREGARQ